MSTTQISKRHLGAAAVLLTAAAVMVTTVVFATGGGGGMGGAPGGQSGRMAETEKVESVINVKLSTPTLGSIIRNTEFIGKIEPAESLSIYPEMSGKITELYFEAGQTVNAGDLLLKLDSTDLEFSLEKAQASYDEKVVSAQKTLGSDYTSKLISAQNSLAQKQRSYRTARNQYSEYASDLDHESLAKLDDTRTQTYDDWQAALEEQRQYAALPEEDRPEEYEEVKAALYKAASEAYKVYDDAYQTYVDALNEDESTSSYAVSKDNAATDVKEAQESLELATGDAYEDLKAVTEASLNTAQLSLLEAERNLNKAYVYAPVGGVIETREVDPYGMASSNSAICTIYQPGQTTVAFNASSDGAAALSIGDAITVTKGGKIYDATVVELESRADSATGLFPVKANIAEPDSTLLAGVTVKVSAATAKAENVLLVPIDLVYYDGEDPYVFVYLDGKAKRVEITTGMSDAQTIVAETGLTETDSLITTWHPDLADGVAVNLADGTASSEGTDPAEGIASPDGLHPVENAAPADDTALADGSTTAQQEAE